MALAEASGERWFDAEIFRIASEIEWGSTEPKGSIAQHYCEQALDVARAQQARSLELRAAVSLARPWCDKGRRTETCDLFAPVCEWFTEGFDTPDQKEAKALLKKLAPRPVLWDLPKESGENCLLELVPTVASSRFSAARGYFLRRKRRRENQQISRGRGVRTANCNFGGLDQATSNLRRLRTVASS
jgi:hypothetical protein